MFINNFKNAYNNIYNFSNCYIDDDFLIFKYSIIPKIFFTGSLLPNKNILLPVQNKETSHTKSSPVLKSFFKYNVFFSEDNIPKFSIKFSKRKSAYIDLYNEDSLLLNFKGKVRTSYKKSLKYNFSIFYEEHIENEFVLNEIYKMLSNFYKSKKLNFPFNESSFKKFCYSMSDSISIITAYDESKFIGFIINFVDNDFSRLLYTAVDFNYRSTNISTLLFIKSFSYLEKKSVKKYDFSGIGVDNVDKFKLSFNPITYTYYRCLYV